MIPTTSSTAAAQQDSQKGIIQSHRIRAMYGLIFASTFHMRPESVVLHAGSIMFNGSFVTLMPSMSGRNLYPQQAVRCQEFY
jgi:hypothetical protein